MVWTSKQVVEIVGMTYRQLDYWLRTDKIKIANKADGSGSRRQFFQEDVVVLRVMKEIADLANHEVETGQVREAIRDGDNFLLFFKDGKFAGYDNIDEALQRAKTSIQVNNFLTIVQLNRVVPKMEIPLKRDPKGVKRYSRREKKPPVVEAEPVLKGRAMFDGPKSL